MSKSSWFESKPSNLVVGALGAFGSLFAVVRIGELLMNKPKITQDKMSFFDLMEIEDRSEKKVKLRVLKTAGCVLVLGLGLVAADSGCKALR